MSRQLEAASEERERAKRKTIAIALGFGLADALQYNDFVLLGFAFKLKPHTCLMTVKAQRGSRKYVAFVATDTPANCILNAFSASRNGGLTWKEDQYHKSGG